MGYGYFYFALNIYFCVFCFGSKFVRDFFFYFGLSLGIEYLCLFFIVVFYCVDMGFLLMDVDFWLVRFF